MSLNVNKLSTEFFKNINCCIAELAYKALTQDMFLKPDRFKTFKAVKYLQGLYSALDNYTKRTGCLTEEEANSILTQVTDICAICSKCSDKFI